MEIGYHPRAAKHPELHTSLSSASDPIATAQSPIPPPTHGTHFIYRFFLPRPLFSFFPIRNPPAPAAVPPHQYRYQAHPGPAKHPELKISLISRSKSRSDYNNPIRPNTPGYPNRTPLPIHATQSVHPMYPLPHLSYSLLSSDPGTPLSPQG